MTSPASEMRKRTRSTSTRIERSKQGAEGAGVSLGRAIWFAGLLVLLALLLLRGIGLGIADELKNFRAALRARHDPQSDDGDTTDVAPNPTKEDIRNETVH